MSDREYGLPMTIHWKFVLSAAFGLAISACSSTETSSEEFTSAELKGGREMSLTQNNPFAWKKDDVQRGDGDVITGGKRSSFDKRVASSYGTKDSSPKYTSKRYQSKAWVGNKDYSKGSFRTQEWGSNKKSRYAGRASNEAGSTARAAGQKYKTGQFGSGSARESTKSAVNHTANSYGGKRWGYKPPIYSYDEYRQMTIGQTRSLLGKD